MSLLQLHAITLENVIRLQLITITNLINTTLDSRKSCGICSIVLIINIIGKKINKEFLKDFKLM